MNVSIAYLEIIRIFTVCYLGRKGRSLTTNAQGKKIGVRRVRKTDRKALFRTLKKELLQRKSGDNGCTHNIFY
jgi:hypothetical protein